MKLDPLIERLQAKDRLQPGEMTAFMEALMAGELATDEVVRFLTALSIEDLTVEILTEAAGVMRKNAVRIKPRQSRILDTCGTGGDGLKSINVSTLAALTAAAAGVTVAKHGNRAVTSVSGSADVLKALGVSLDLAPEEVLKSIDEVGFGFMFAPRFHPAMKHAQAARQQIRQRTIFNVLGPLTNPALAGHHLLGVFDRHLVEVMCQALGQMGGRHLIVVHGEDGSDEVSLTAGTHVAEWQGGRMTTYDVTPEDFGFKRVSHEALRLESTEAIARATEDVLAGRPGPHRDFVLLNAGFALKAADAAGDVETGIAKASALLESQAVRRKLDDIRRFTDKLVQERAGKP